MTVEIEYEAKILGVDVDDVNQRILAAGGSALGSGTTRRYTYDLNSDTGRRWIRLREMAGRATVAIKEQVHDGISGTSELEVEVGDFATAAELLARLGFDAKTYQETRRASYELEGARLEIDEWPLLEPYLEIESSSQDHVLRIAKLLGFDAESVTGVNTTEIYAQKGIDLDAIKELRFEQPEPEGRTTL
ncbi:class IV adenylate cyclase [Streptomyces sp. NPDC093060]|uniref:class IV adenylate cyclase n=1 Tax=Streptomyces sp. NPDC093060 TaxID=3366019 RepID=UPI0037F59842